MKNKHIKPIAATVLTTSLLSFGLTTTVQAATKVPKVDQTAILKKGKLVKKSSGKVIKNYASFKGKIYKNGKIYSGKLNSKLYTKGKLANGFYSKKLYTKGVLFSGIHNKKFYKNGVKATGTHKGKYYSKGTIANGVIAKTYYKNGVKATATYKGVYYRNGKAYNSKLNSTIYKNGKVDHVATISFRSDKIQTTLKQYKLQAEYQQLAFQLAEKYGFADQSQTQKLQTKTAFIVTPDQVGNLRTLFQSGLVPGPKQQQQLDEIAQSGALSPNLFYPAQQILINNESSLNQSLGALPPSLISSPSAELIAALLEAQKLQLEKEKIHSSLISPTPPSPQAIRGNQLLAEFGKVDELAKLNNMASFTMLQATLKAQQWTDDLTADSYVAFVRKALDEMKMPYTLTYKIENGKIIFDLQAFGQNESMTAVSDEMKALEATDALLNANSLTQNANDFTLSQAKLLVEKLKKEQLKKDLEEKQKKAAELLAANSPKFNQTVALINSFKWQPNMSQDEFQAAFEKFINGLGLKDGISLTFKDNTFNFTYSSDDEKRDFATAAPWKAIEDQLMLILNNPNATKDQLNEAKKLLDALQNPAKKAELLNRVDVAIENLNPIVPPQPSEFDRIKTAVVKIEWDDDASPDQHMVKVKDAIKHLSGSAQVEYNVSSPYTLTVKLGSQSFTVKAGWLETEEKVRAFLEPENKTYENAVEIQKVIALIESKYPEVSKRLTDDIKSTIQIISNKKEQEIKGKVDEFKWNDEESADAASTRFIEFMRQIEQEGIHFSITSTSYNNFHYSFTIFGKDIPSSLIFAPWHVQQSQIDAFLINENSTIANAVNVKRSVDTLQKKYPRTHANLLQSIQEKHDQLLVTVANEEVTNFIWSSNESSKDAAGRFKQVMAQHSIIVKLDIINDSSFQYTLDTIGPYEIYTIMKTE